MNIRAILLAGAAALALAAPAQAGEGWYLGLGAGWDMLNQVRISGAGLDGGLQTRDTGIAEVTAGYKFGDFRLEAETAWDRHNAGPFDSGGVITPVGQGHVEMRSALLNGIYDIPVLPRLHVSIGAGAGVGSDRIKFFYPPPALRSRTATACASCGRRSEGFHSRRAPTSTSSSNTTIATCRAQPAVRR